MSFLNHRSHTVRVFVGTLCAVVLGTLSAFVPQPPNTIGEGDFAGLQAVAAGQVDAPVEMLAAR